MKSIEVDPEARVCRAEAGLTWGELDAATQRARAGGHRRPRLDHRDRRARARRRLGLDRAQCGYAADNLLSVEVVTADGRILTASENEHPELFWATRGGGGNFGVATRFELALHPIGPTVLAGMLLYPARDGRRGAAQLPRRDGRRRGRDRLGRRADHGAGRRRDPRAGPRTAGRRRRPLLRRARGAGRGGAAAAARVRAAGARPGRADALRRPPASSSTPTSRRGCATTGRATS